MMEYTQTWDGCYDGSWRDIIVDEAFAHPAKYAPGLIERIIDHGQAAGWWQRGDTIGDPFGGVGTGGIICGSRGLKWIGVELEAHFVELAAKNFAFNQRLFDEPPYIVQGDSRRFDELVGQVAGVVCSPPYATGDTASAASIAGRTDKSATWIQSNTGAACREGYGQSPGQIGAMKPVQVDAVVSSPPYAESIKGAHAERETAAESQAARTTAGGSLGQSQRHGGYGGPGNIGNLNTDTYWHAVRDVYSACRKALKPGGVMALVVKDYVKNKQRVTLCDDTIRLCADIGLEPIERIQAMLVKQTTHDGLFGDVTETKERKSFFRRLAEKKGSPRIDWEEVLVFRNG